MKFFLPSNTPKGQRDAVTADEKIITVGAGAGTGKTWVLSGRYIRLLIEEKNLLPSNILTLTFTEAAASEMKTRIIDRIEKEEGRYYSDVFKNFSGLISPKHFFDDSELLTSNWHDYKDKQSKEYSIKYYLNLNRERTYKWISPSQLPKNKATKDLHKVFIPAAGGSGNDDVVLGKPFYGEPNSVCSQTFLVIGYDSSKHALSKKNCDSIISYIRTKFFRYLVSIKKKTQNGPRGVYQFVPIQDFSHPWTDEALYEKYKLTEEEISYIESMIRPME